MGKKARKVYKGGQVGEWQAIIFQSRQKWLGKTVKLREQTGYRDTYGKVTSISSGGDVVVEPLPGRAGQFVGVVMSLGYVDQMLIIVD